MLTSAIPMPQSNGAGPQVPSLIAPQPPGGTVVQMGGLRAASLQTVLNEEAKEAEVRQAAPLLTGIAGHIAWKFQVARDAKRMYVEPRMIRNLRNRRSEYSPEKLLEIQKMGGSTIFAGITGLKCRAAASWIKDVIMSTGSERAWSINPTPVPDLPPEMNELLIQQATQPIKEAMMAGQEVDTMQAVSMMSMLRDQALSAIREEARVRAERMSDKMEDQFIEGRYYKAVDEFVNDLTTYPAALLKGPVIRMRPKLVWGPNGEPIVTVKLAMEWERVDPFRIYPSPAATGVDDGDLIEKHQLSRKELQALKGAPGYDAGAIDLVLRDFSSGLSQWIFDTSEQNNAQGRPESVIVNNSDGLIDALQYWGSVQGQMLLDWGMTKEQVPDPLREYEVEAWLIGPHVIKAMLNPDPLCRRPYYKASYEEIPGAFWGNSVADLVADCQDVVNASARSLINNMALSSGPQVGILSDRLAAGEDVTQLFPWRIWQMTSDPMNGTPQPPIQFFQPQSNADQLLAVYEKYSLLADEYSGIPRYMTGDGRAGGAGRTASGLSMLMTNAGKSIRAVIANIDINVQQPVLERLYYYNMRFGDDPELKGDVNISARGATMLVAKEAAQVRRTEFLAATANPIDMEIVGVEGRAHMLREVAKTLDMDVDKIVPPIEILRQRWAAKQALAAAQPVGTPAGPGSTQNNEQQLMDESPVTDNF